MKKSLSERIPISVINYFDYDIKHVICNFVKEKLGEKIEEDKINHISKGINNIDEKYVSDAINDYLEKNINEIKSNKCIPNLSDDYKNNFIRSFFENNNSFNSYYKDIEEIFNKYFSRLEELEEYIASTFSKSEQIIYNKVKQVGRNSEKGHKNIEQVIKKTEESVIKEIRKQGKLGMISIEDNKIINFDIQYESILNEDNLKYVFCGNTIDYTDTDVNKLILKLKCINVGNDLLHNVTVKKFEINSINDFDYDAFKYTNICFYKEDKIIQNTLLPGISSQLIFVVSPLNINNFHNVYEEIGDDLEINIDFDIKLDDEKTITQEFEIFCSKYENKNEFKIDFVNNSFKINNDKIQ